MLEHLDRFSGDEREALAWQSKPHLDDDSYEAMCDISARISCTAVFKSEYAHPLSHWGLVPKGSPYDLGLILGQSVAVLDGNADCAVLQVLAGLTSNAVVATPVLHAGTADPIATLPLALTEPGPAEKVFVLGFPSAGGVTPTPKKYAGATCFPQFSIGEVVEFPRRQWDSGCTSKALGAF